MQEVLTFHRRHEGLLVLILCIARVRSLTSFGVDLDRDYKTIPSYRTRFLETHCILGWKCAQKFLFYDTPDAITHSVRPYWVSKFKGKVQCVQALDDMLEMLPPGQSKGAGVTMLLDHLGVPLDEVSLLLTSLITSCQWRSVTSDDALSDDAESEKLCPINELWC